MRLKRIYILVAFIFSLLFTSLHCSNVRPPLLKYEDTDNIVLLIDGHNFYSQEIITSSPQEDMVIINGDMFFEELPFSLAIGIFIVCRHLLMRKNSHLDIFEFTGIVFRYPHRILLN